MIDRDDFAGPGGWDEGGKALGIRAVGIELDPHAVATAEAAGHHRALASVTSDDVRTYPWGILRLYVASPPCQTFSPAGNGEGRQHFAALVRAMQLVADGATPEDAVAAVSDEALDERTILVLEPMLVIRNHRPVMIAMEQVKTVLPIWEAYAVILREWGYSVWTGLLHSEQYGVPQTRTRAILMAHREREVTPPAPTHSRYYPRDKARLDDGVLPWVSMAEALGWAPPDGLALRSNYGTGGNPAARGIRLATEPAPTVTSKVNRNLWQIGPTPANEGTTDEDMAWVYSRPSPTIVGSYRPDIVAAPKYRKPGDGPRQKAKGSVRITLEEAAVLQSFPADYPWQGTLTQRFQQVGNAVPPLMARAILAALVED